MRWLIYIIILLMSAIWLSSCRTPQYIPVETKIQLKDSVITRDSVVIKEQTVRKDSVVIKDSTVIVVDESGNVIRTELYRYRDWYKELSRDYSVLQAKYDSLFSEKQKEIQVPYPVERELSWWQSIKLQVGEIDHRCDYRFNHYNCLANPSKEITTKNNTKIQVIKLWVPLLEKVGAFFCLMLKIFLIAFALFIFFFNICWRVLILNTHNL